MGAVGSVKAVCGAKRATAPPSRELKHLRSSKSDTPNEAWAQFAATGVFPTLDSLGFLARAITPPERPRRFDARFFVADASLIAREVPDVVGAEAEFVELAWKKLEAALELDLPNITRNVLGILAALGDGPHDRFRRRPFFHRISNRWLNEELCELG